jgi:chloramphenicol 3-O phosphotransferase
MASVLMARAVEAAAMRIPSALMSAGKVIFLNGSSSAGKTTLAIALQQLLEEPYQHIALDQFRDGLPGRYRGLNSPEGTPGDLGLNIVPVEKQGERVTEVRFGAHGEQVLRGMRRAIAAFAREGNNVIIDDLLFKADYLTDYADALAGLDAWLIGVRCCLEVVNARESQRSGRFPGTATSHFHEVHGHGVAYDLEVDTSASTPKACALQIASRLKTPPGALASLGRRG